MEFLVRNKYNIVSLHKLKKLLEDGKPIPYKTVAITFDDGYENNYTNAFDTLNKHNIPATVFVVVDKIGRSGYLTWRQIEEMAGNNIDIGSHTLSECYLPSLKDKAELKREIYGSRRIIKKRIPEAGDFIAYCSGGFNENIRQIVIDAGYDGACATNPGKDYPDNDIYAIKRIRISRTSDNLFVFWIETSGFYTWIKEHRDDD
jgi:peptidoglycan/xylan/chitin deacetylase (PgdA/CDA1 family)